MEPPSGGAGGAHPRGKEIYALATALEEAPEVLTAKLAGGKVCFLHEALWPSLWRVVSDPEWRKAATRKLSPAAARLLASVERAGQLQADLVATDPDAKRAAKKARDELEHRGLVRTCSVHTDRGSHATVLEAWKSWVPGEVRAAGDRLALADALAALEARGLRFRHAARPAQT